MRILSSRSLEIVHAFVASVAIGSMDVACTIRCYAQTSAIVRVVPLNIAQAGADDIKKHKWFASDGNTYWEDMLAKKLPPPIKPEVGSESDTSQFEYVNNPTPSRKHVSRSTLVITGAWVPRCPPPPCCCYPGSTPTRSKALHRRSMRAIRSCSPTFNVWAPGWKCHGAAGLVRRISTPALRGA